MVSRNYSNFSYINSIKDLKYNNLKFDEKIDRCSEGLIKFSE